MRIFGKGFNFSQDGPGNRLVYHLSGCNMRCPWCSNPEGFDTNAGTSYSVSQLLAECERSKPMFFGSGGVTFTGGESTLQAAELMEILQKLQDSGIHTAIETNGTSPQLPLIAQHVDYLIMDFKHYDSDILRSHTGAGNEIIKQNFSCFCQTGRQLHTRIPLIRGFNSDDPAAFASYFSQHNTQNVVFELLPYHEYGKSKWQMPYTISDGFITTETLEQFRRVFHAHGLALTET